MADGRKSHPVTVLAGIKNKLGRMAQKSACGGTRSQRAYYPGLLGQDRGKEAKPPPPPTEGDCGLAWPRRRPRPQDADVVIAVMGEIATMSSEAASRATLDLPGIQEQMLEAVASTGKPVVLVLENGRPLDHSLGGGACAGDSGGMVSGNGRRQCGRRCAVWRCEPGREAAGELAARRRRRSRSTTTTT